VLLAGDSAIYRTLISRHLRDWGFDLVVAEDGEAAWTLLREAEAPDLALLDWVLPGLDGIELCRRIRQSGQGRYIYTVLLTAKEGKEHLLEAMKAGADDYLVKPFEPQELEARLLAGKRIVDLQHELIEAREALRMQATYDPLTKLLNRGQILSLLDTELIRCKREQKSVGIILLDIDHFKSVNDSFGHLAGDAVLVEVSKRLKANLRIYDGIGRYGGEEFLVVLPGCDLENAAKRAEEKRQFVGQGPITIGTTTLRVTISLGVTSATPNCNIGAETLISEADKALYQAKRNGRDRVEMHKAGKFPT